MPYLQITQLIFTFASINKLGARSISEGDIRELPWNKYVVLPNPSAGDVDRRILIGQTNSGRYLTVVIEATHDPTVWTVVTGWNSSDAQRRLLGR